MCRILAMAVSLARVVGRVRFIYDPATGTLVPDGPSRLTAYIYHQGPREKSPDCCRCAASPHACPASTSRTAGSYASLETALAAARAWDGHEEPRGALRHPTSDRRRPGGDPARKYI